MKAFRRISAVAVAIVALGMVGMGPAHAGVGDSDQTAVDSPSGLGSTWGSISHTS